MRVVLKGFSYIVTGLLVALLIIVIVSLLTSRVNGGVPKVLGHEILNVLSGSMEPAIKTGSIIAIQPNFPTDQLKAGDVITYKSIDNPEMKITHRIVEIETVGGQLQFITKGDNNDAIDPIPIPENLVVGKYAGLTVPYMGQILSFVKTKTGIILFMIIPGILIILWQMVNVWRMITRMETKEGH
jgi:signal peptidase